MISPVTPTSRRGPLWSLDTPSSPSTFSGIPTAPSTPLQLPLESSLLLAPGGTSTRERDIEKEADVLFRDHAVEEIRGIEKKTRLDIDRRKEDLRQMVGERYRDLIDAADSIIHMKKCSDQALNSVTKMEESCRKLQQTHFLRGSGGSRGPLLKSGDHSIAAQIKLLAESADKIWLCLEGQEYLTASHHYLLARHIFSLLSVNLGRGNERNFAVVQRLWHSVACFKENILQCCNCRLQCPDIETDHMVQSLCAIVLLEGCSPRQSLSNALLARKAAVQSLLVAGQGSHQLHRSVKSQVCELVKTIVQSLADISTIFCTRTGKNGKMTTSLLVQSLMLFRDSEKKQDVIPTALAERLPDSINNFAPTISTTSLTEIPPNDIYASARDWIAMCVSDVHSRMEAVLQHITTFKGLAGIREAVHSVLTQLPSPLKSGVNERESGGLEVARVQEEWRNICASVLGQDLCVWETFLRPLLLQRAKVIVDSRLTKAGETACGLLDKLVVNECASDQFGGVTSENTHMWEEDQANILLKTARGTQVTPLSLKVKACSPSVFGFCQSFDQQLREFINDITHYLDQPDCKSHQVDIFSRSQHSVKIQSFPFSLASDSVLLQDYVLQSTLDTTKRFVKNINSKMADIQEQLASNNQGSAINRLMSMGGLCLCLLDCCPSFSFLALGCRQQDTTTRKTSQSRVVHRKELEDRNIPVCEKILLEEANLIFLIWSEWCASEVICHLKDQFSADLQLSSLVSTLEWDLINISEEAETGETISSVIRVPSQTSVYVTSLLFSLCQEISRVGGHALNRSLLENLSGKVFVGVLESYETLLQDFTSVSVPGGVAGIPQSCALQLLFNLKFISNVLVHSSVESEQVGLRLKHVVDCLQSCVDPFDLDVFLPHILENRERQLIRSSVIFGVLLAVKGSSLSSSFYKSNPSNTQEKHIVIPLAAPVSRLPTLPVTLSSQVTASHQNVLIQNVDISTSSSSLHQTVAFFHHL